jgi:DNA-binding NarL/FixJ family response regulator
MKKIRVFLVDDHEVLCYGLRQLLEQEVDISVLGEAYSGEQALASLQSTPVDVVLMDIRLTGIDGIDTLRKLKAAHPEVRVLMLTSYGDEYLAQALKAGANGYLLKRANRIEIVQAVRDAANGGAPLDSLVTPNLVARLRDPKQHRDCPLSSREVEVLQLAAVGMSNKEIARLLGLSDPTVKNHFSSILRKLDANDRTHAVTIALRNAWISITALDLPELQKLYKQPARAEAFA